ncbi:MAG: ferrochelatase, partial [Anaerolineae bacterium]|nr:ferrochelatase [Anaerolineae bacterium]
MTIYGAQTADSPKFDDEARSYDALLVLSFGGPEAMDDVMPFLLNVAEGRNIPRERLEEVAVHYYDFGGVSPINGQNRLLIAALEAKLGQHGPNLPVYFGNRNWHPFLTDTIRQMREDGIRRALVFVTSAFSSYSGCRQYREDVIRACETLGEGVPEFDKLRVFYNHPGFIEPVVEKTRQALTQFPAESQPDVRLVFTAHSIPMGMARNSDYVAQLEETCRLVAERIGRADYRLVYQSRSGPPQVPWLEPDICDHLRQIHGEGVRDVLLVPIGFISDHMEVLFDLDTEAKQLASELGMRLTRAETVGTHPAFIQ